MTLSKPVYSAGEYVSFEVLSRQSSYLYCYVQNGDGKIQRIVPNRFVADLRINAMSRSVYQETCS